MVNSMQIKLDIKNYIGYLVLEEKSCATIEKYQRDIFRFAQFAAGRDLDKKLILEYKSYLADRYAISSANSMLAALNSFLRFLGLPDRCVRHFKVQRNAYCARERELQKSEYLKLVSAAREKHSRQLSLLMQTICSTGIRVSEVKYITREAVHCGEATITCKGKTRKVFIPAKLRKKLMDYAKARRIQSGAIFITRSGKPLDRSHIWRQMKGLCKCVDILPSKVFPHNLRHLFARVFYNQRHDIVKLADILGHSNINTTRIYTISTGDEHRKIIEALHLIL